MGTNLRLVILSTFLFLSIALGQEEPTPALWVVANHTQPCSPFSLLPIPHYCRSYGGTVRCKIDPPAFSGTCECNLEDDAVFDEDQQICVALVGGLCFTQPTSLGKKVCIKGADCMAEHWNGTTIGDHTVGTCACMPGFEEINRTCSEIEGGTTGTPKPTTTRSPLFPPIQITSPTTPGTRPTAPSGASSWQKKPILSAIFLSFTLLVPLLR